MANQRPKVKPISRMLNDPNKEIHQTYTYGGVGMLSKLWRIILKDLNIGGYRFDMLMERFLSDPENNVPNNPKERFNNRGNLNKEMSNPAMSWKVFLKCMRFLGLREFRITLEAVHSDGKITSHAAKVSLLESEATDTEAEDLPVNGVETPNLPVPEDQEHIPYLDDEDY